jgi:hypothetical protein
MRRIDSKTDVLTTTHLQLREIHDTPPSDRPPTCFSSLRSCFEGTQDLTNGVGGPYIVHNPG